MAEVCVGLSGVQVKARDDGYLLRVIGPGVSVEIELTLGQAREVAELLSDEQERGSE